MKHLFCVLMVIFATLTAFAQEGSVTKATATVSVSFAPNMNPIVHGSISNNSGCVWNGRIVYKGNGVRVTSVIVEMFYGNMSNLGYMEKVVQVNVNPGQKGDYRIEFPRYSDDGRKAFSCSVTGVRFADGTVFWFRQPYNKSF